MKEYRGFKLYKIEKDEIAVADDGGWLPFIFFDMEAAKKGCDSLMDNGYDKEYKRFSSIQNSRNPGGVVRAEDI